MLGSDQSSLQYSRLKSLANTSTLVIALGENSTKCFGDGSFHLSRGNFNYEIWIRFLTLVR